MAYTTVRIAQSFIIQFGMFADGQESLVYKV